MQISKLQSQRKSLSTPEEPTSLDILLITIQDILSYHRRSQQRLAPGLYLGYLKLCSSVDQIKVLVLQKLPNILCHVKIRDNSNVSKEEWEWIQSLSGSESMENMDHSAECPTRLFFELQMAMKALLKQINLPLRQQIDEIWREMRWINEALQYARYRQPSGGLPITKLVDLSEEPIQKKISSTSSHLDCLPSPPPSPETETHRRKAMSDSQPYSDEEGCSEVFLPTDSDYDSSDALSPRELDLVYLSSQDISHQAVSCLSGSAPDVLQVHDIKACLTPKQNPKGVSTVEADVDQSTEFMQSLSIGGLSPKSTEKNPGLRQPLSFLGKKKHGKHQHYSYFSRQHRWLRVHSETQSMSLSEGLYTPHLTRATEFSQEPTFGEQISISIDCPRTTFLSHASSLPEEGKDKYEELRPSIHRIYVEPFKSMLPSEDGKAWALSTQPVGDENLHSPTGQRKFSEDRSNSSITEVFSSDL
uniref:Uncharacterized protein n=1 Tax=Anolis carolinensis TaxID=28377 RepID=H9GES2_ANOCA